MPVSYLNFPDEHLHLINDHTGIAQSEIEKIESIFNVRLPEAYKEFLLKFGKESGYLLASYYMEYPGLLENRTDAIEAINFDDRKSDSEKPLIKDSYFFFGQWQGYIFYFFDCSEGKQDPEIFILTDGLEIKSYASSFSEFIRTEGLKPLLDAINNYGK